MEHALSPLPKTWIFDLDGTVVKHNGYIIDGHDTLLDGASDFFAELPPDDMVIFITSRERKYASQTESFLYDNGIRFAAIVYEAPFGERILINDNKPSGLATALAISTERDCFLKDRFSIDEQL